MKLTQEQIQKVESFLKKKVASKCPVCGSGTMEAKQTESFQLLSLNDSSSITNSTYINLIGAVCSNCKHVTLFHLSGILDEE